MNAARIVADTGAGGEKPGSQVGKGQAGFTPAPAEFRHVRESGLFLRRPVEYCRHFQEVRNFGEAVPAFGASVAGPRENGKVRARRRFMPGQGERWAPDGNGECFVVKAVVPSAVAVEGDHIREKKVSYPAAVAGPLRYAGSSSEKCRAKGGSHEKKPVRTGNSGSQGYQRGPRKEEAEEPDDPGMAPEGSSGVLPQYPRDALEGHHAVTEPVRGSHDHGLTSPCEAVPPTHPEALSPPWGAAFPRAERPPGGRNPAPEHPGRWHGPICGPCR